MASAMEMSWKCRKNRRKRENERNKKRSVENPVAVVRPTGWRGTMRDGEEEEQRVVELLREHRDLRFVKRASENMGTGWSGYLCLL